MLSISQKYSPKNLYFVSLFLLFRERIRQSIRSEKVLPTGEME